MITDEQLKAAREAKPEWMERPWYNDPATDNQKGYIATLVETRAIEEEWLLKIKEYLDTGTLTKGVAGKVIKSLQELPWKQEAVESRNQRSIPKPTWKDVPAGYYALPNPDAAEGENDIYFYKVWKPKGVEDRGKLYMVVGPDYQDLARAMSQNVLKNIVRFGVGDSAVLYGKKIGSCSQCNRRLSNRVSRELGIGPKCGGRVYSTGWQERVKAARQAIIDRGEDPNERV